jgi:hypothetical protein
MPPPIRCPCPAEPERIGHLLAYQVIDNHPTAVQNLVGPGRRALRNSATRARAEGARLSELPELGPDTDHGRAMLSSPVED